jgi:hypothetical protein
MIMSNKPVKVLSLVSYKFLPPDMGGQKGIAFFNRYLAKQVKLACVTIKDNQQSSSEGYDIYPILGNSKSRYVNPFYFFTLSRIIRKEKITHLVLEHPYYGWLGVLLKWFCDVQLIVHSHNIEALRFKSTGKWWWNILWYYEKNIHRHAHHNFFIQQHDRDYAITNFKLDPNLCTVITYGFELSQAPAAADKQAARAQLCREYNIPPQDKLLLFNGTLGYKPNLDALVVILDQVNPFLLAAAGFNYKIIICGNKLPGSYGHLSGYRDKNIIYAGFVEDINLYFKGCDIFINPVIDGGGIKTKLVEALGNDLSVISTQSGAIGISTAITGDKLQVIADGDWPAFARAIISFNSTSLIPAAFFDNFYWGNIAARAAAIINTTGKKDQIH